MISKKIVKDTEGNITEVIETISDQRQNSIELNETAKGISWKIKVYADNVKDAEKDAKEYRAAAERQAIDMRV